MARHGEEIAARDPAAESARTQRIRALLWWLAWLVAVLPIVWRRVTTSDAWWHVALGRWMASHHAAPDFSQWYFTPVRQPVADLRWTWLGDLILGAAHALGGVVALQALPLLCLAIAAAVVRDLGQRQGARAVWTWAVAVLLAAGTYQLQLPRNAVFSLPLLALAVWLCATSGSSSPRRCWLVPLAGAWSCLHGSYPLAVVVVLGWCAGEWLDEWRAPQRWLRAGRALLLAVLCYGAVSIANPTAVSLFLTPYRQLTHQPSPTPASAVIKLDGPPACASPAPDSSLARWLNRWLLPAGPGGMRSGDFASPFDRMDYRPVPVAFALGMLALVRLLFARELAWRWIALLVAVALLGSAYLRMTGYLALGAALCLVAAPAPREWLRRAAPIGAVAACGLVALGSAAAWWFAAKGRLGEFVGRSTHEFGIGAVAIFDDRAAAWALERHPQARTFTTIVTGSHALLTWAGKKPVFIDGFFAPHTTALWADYRDAELTRSPRTLAKRYGIELALVEHGRTDWNNAFLDAPDWRPAAIGAGATVYARRDSAAAREPIALLVKADEAARLSPYFKHTLATDYFSACLASILAGDVPRAKALHDADPQLFSMLLPWLDAKQQAAASRVEDVLAGRLEIRPANGR